MISTPSHDLNSIYDAAFFREYGATNGPYASACRFIAEEIATRFAPRTAVDWGCGAGLHCAALRNRGVDIIGIDGANVARQFRAKHAIIRQADLSHPIPASLTFSNYDLSLCIDVLEHLHEHDSATALQNVTRGATTVILSCAPKGQGGHHHVNEQPRRYWIRRMQDIGWHYQRGETGQMEQFFLRHRDHVPFSWMYHNLCVYRPAKNLQK